MVLESCAQSRQEFNFHFYGQALSSDNPYYKMDALVWKNLFRRKVEDRYIDQVYKFGQYFVKMFELVNTLSFEDIAHGLAIPWDAGCLYGNYSDYMATLIPPLSQSEMEEELASGYGIKRFEYEYKHPQELALTNLKRTFANLVAKDKLFGLKLAPNVGLEFDALSGERKQEVVQSVLGALRPIRRADGYEDDIAVSKRNLQYDRDNTQLDFVSWAQSYFSLLKPQVKEMMARKVSMKQYESELQANAQVSAYEAERFKSMSSGDEYSLKDEADQELEALYHQEVEGKPREEGPVLSRDRRAAPTLEEMQRVSEENLQKEKMQKKRRWGSIF